MHAELRARSRRANLALSYPATAKPTGQHHSSPEGTDGAQEEARDEEDRCEEAGCEEDREEDHAEDEVVLRPQKPVLDAAAAFGRPSHFRLTDR